MPQNPVVSRFRKSQIDYNVNNAFKLGTSASIYCILFCPEVTVPFAYSIMHRSHPVEKSKLEKEFVDECLARTTCVLTLVETVTWPGGLVRNSNACS